MATSDLSARLAYLPANGLLKLDPGELRTNLVIDRPVRLRGSGPSTHVQAAPGTGPAIHVRCAGVVLEHLGVEHLDETGFAVLADPGTDPVCHNLTITGGRTGGCVLTTGPASATDPPPSANRTARLPVLDDSGDRPPPSAATAAITSPVPVDRIAPPAQASLQQPTTARAPSRGLGSFAIPLLIVALLGAGLWVRSRRDSAHDPMATPAVTVVPSVPSTSTPPPTPVRTTPAPAATASRPPVPVDVSFVGWDAVGGAAVVDARYRDLDGESMALRLVFDPRAPVDDHLGGPAPRKTYRLRRGEIADPVLVALWNNARPTGAGDVIAQPTHRGVVAPDRDLRIVVDAEARWLAGRMVPATVADIPGGYRVTWRRWSDAVAGEITIGGPIQRSDRNVVTFHAVDGSGATWDLLQLDGNLAGDAPMESLYQDVRFHWLGGRVLVTVNESTDGLRVPRGAYYLRSAGPQIKLLYPPGQRARGEQVADQLERDLGRAVTTVEQNADAVRPGVFFRSRVDPRAIAPVPVPGDAGNGAVADAIQELLGLPLPEVQPLKWIDVLVVLAPG